MDSKVDTINNCVKIYRALTEFPTINSAEIRGSSSSDLIKVSAVWSQRNIEMGEITKFKKDYVMKGSDILFVSIPTDVSSHELTKSSPSEKYHCILKKTKVDNKKMQFLEIWNENGLYRNFDVGSFDVHGDIYADGEFGTLEWSPKEDKVLYIAEKKAKKSEPFYKQKSADSSDQDAEKAAIVFEEYIYKPDWGEQLVDKHQPVIGICNIESETLKVLDGIPANFSPGQLIWAKDGSGLFGVVLENEPRRLGLIYCTNRLGYIFHLSLKGEFKILSEKNKSVRSPRLSPNGKCLFWLQRPVAGAHNGCQQLVRLNLITECREVLVDIVRVGDKTFSGIFLHSLPTRCFSKDGVKLFFSSCNRQRNLSYYVDLVTKEVNLVEIGEGSSTILDVHDDLILVSSGSLQRPPSLMMSPSVVKIRWIPITQSKTICCGSVLKEIDLESTTGKHKLTYYNALYYGPPAPEAPEQKVPLVVYPHGGPHSSSVNDYALEPNFLVSMGYGVLFINYRGSTGMGQDSVEFLQGKIGDTDVKDNHEAVLHILKSVPYLDQKNVFLNGKSHGGFLVAHLSGQYPDFYRAVVSGNPVVDVSAMYVMSDIPDWATSECGLAFDESKPLTKEQIDKMTAASPIQLADKIKAPTLFLLGKKDLRVPCYEGIKMYNALKARKVKVRLNLYDDNHTLSNVPNHMDWMINSALWYVENKA